jgi:hypothetical protein
MQFKKDFMIWYMVLSTAMNLGNMVIFYNDPTWGFAHFGIGIILTALFPVLWVLIYVYCKIKDSKNPEIAEQKSKTEKGDELK